MSARTRDKGNARDFVYFAEDNGETIQIALVSSEIKNKLLTQHRIPESIRKDAPRTLEFRLVGDVLTLTLNNSLTLTAKDSSQPVRLFAVSGTKGVLVQKIEVQSLDKVAPSPAIGNSWQTLFNGKDLTSWKVLGVNGWTVENGVLTGQTSQGKGPGWLMTEKEFTDYELELEYQISSGSNSGLFPKAFPFGNVSGKDFTEVQLLDDQSPEFTSVPATNRSGSIFGKHAPNPVPVVPANQWHRLRMKLQGKTLELAFNDIVVMNREIPDLPASGHIGLQLYPTHIEFRNIRVREYASTK